MGSLADYRAGVAISAEEFADRFPDCVFVVEEAGVAQEATGSFTLSITSEALRQSDLQVLAIAKKVPQGHPLRSFVVLGRSALNDIEVKVEGISKFHCYLRRNCATWAILDAGSRNGTRVNGVLLGKGQQRLLNDGDCVRLGHSAILTFYSPIGFQQRLAQEVPSG